MAYVDSSTPDELRALRGTLTRAGQASSYRERGVAENLDLFQRMKEGEFPDGAHVLRLKIDLASPNMNLARSGDLPDPSHDASPHRRQMVRLSVVRLHAFDLRRAGADHAFVLHARIPGPPSAIRLGDRAPGRRRPAAPAAAAATRIRASQPHLYGDEQAQAARAGRRRACRRLGRSAHADACRLAQARLYAGVDSPVRRAHRRFEVRFLDRLERARGLPARRAE